MKSHYTSRAAHTRLALFTSALLATLPVSIASADAIDTLAVAPGYTTHSIELGKPFGGAIAASPGNPQKIYVSSGNYGEHTILEVNLDTGTTRTVSPLIGNIGGLAVLSNGDIAITENLTSDTIIRARDIDADGAFLSPGEITELIVPAHADGSFSGAQAIVAPAANAANLPGGTLLVQTADGSNDADILAILNPESTPAYVPADAPWFTGFTYNGGIGFTPSGHVLCGISEFPVGRILSLVNANANDRIEPGEAHEIVGATTLENSLSDLSVSADGRVLTSENSDILRWFDLPENATDAVETSGILAVTNATYVSSARLNSTTLPFRPGAAGTPATLLVGGFVTYPAATNLLAIKPVPSTTAARGWQWLD